MARWLSNRRKRLTAAAAIFLYATALPTTFAYQDPVSTTFNSSRPYLATPSQAIAHSHKSWLIAAKDTILGSIISSLRVSQYFAYDTDRFSNSDSDTSDSGLLGDTSGFNWGGSTLEVVRSQAIFLTQAAAFGPRITSDDGLRGFLLPIDYFYRIPKNTLRGIHACPYRGGPGWKHDGYLSVQHHTDDHLFSSLPQPSFLADPQQNVSRPPENWIALVERGGGCDFAAKVRVAQALGAVAVVVGDAPSPGWDDRKNPNEEGDPGLSGKRLITMSSTGHVSDIQIPSTFVTRPSYLDLTRLIEELERDEEKWQREHPLPIFDQPPNKKPESPRGLEIIIEKDDLTWEWPLIDLGILLLLLPSIMTVITIITHRIRMIRQRRKDRAPELVVLGLPCLVWRGNGQPWEKIERNGVGPGRGNESAQDGRSPSDINPGDLESGTATESIPLLQEDENDAGPSTRQTPVPKNVSTSSNRSYSFLPPGRTYFSTDECAICLSDFVDGDHVRVLPCGHIFHRQEIDDWLVRIKKLCPICKRDITVPIPPAPPVPVHLPPPSDRCHHSETIASTSASSPQQNEESSETTPLLARDHSV